MEIVVPFANDKKKKLSGASEKGTEGGVSFGVTVPLLHPALDTVI